MPGFQILSISPSKYCCRHSGVGTRPATSPGTSMPGLLAQAEPHRPVGELGPGPVIEGVPHVVEVHVAGLGQRRDQVGTAVAVRCPATPRRPADVAAGRVVAVAVVAGRRDDHALLERGHRVDRLERRARGVDALEGLVQERLVGLGVAELLPLLRRQAVGPHGGVEGRVAGQGEELAVLDVHDHRSRTVGAPVLAAVGEVDAVAKRLLGLRLDLGVQRQHQRVAGLGQSSPGDGLAGLGAAHGVDLDAGQAVATPQPAVVGRLDAALADHVARLVGAVARLSRAALCRSPRGAPGPARRALPWGSSAGSPCGPQRQGRARCARGGATRPGGRRPRRRRRGRSRRRLRASRAAGGSDRSIRGASAGCASPGLEGPPRAGRRPSRARPGARPSDGCRPRARGGSRRSTGRRGRRWDPAARRSSPTAGGCRWPAPRTACRSAPGGTTGGTG